MSENNFVGSVTPPTDIESFGFDVCKIDLPNGKTLSRHTKKIDMSDAAVEYLGYTTEQTDKATIREMLYALSEHFKGGRKGEEDISSDPTNGETTPSPTDLRDGEEIVIPVDLTAGDDGSDPIPTNTEDGGGSSDPLVEESGTPSMEDGEKGLTESSKDTEQTPAKEVETLGDALRFQYSNLCTLIDAVDDAMEVHNMYVVPSSMTAKVQVALSIMHDCRDRSNSAIQAICIHPASAVARRFHTVLRRTVGQTFCKGSEMRVERVTYITSIMATLRKMYQDNPNFVHKILQEISSDN